MIIWDVATWKNPDISLLDVNPNVLVGFVMSTSYRERVYQYFDVFRQNYDAYGPINSTF